MEFEEMVSKWIELQSDLNAKQAEINTMQNIACVTMKKMIQALEIKINSMQKEINELKKVKNETGIRDLN